MVKPTKNKVLVTVGAIIAVIAGAFGLLSSARSEVINEIDTRIEVHGLESGAVRQQQVHELQLEQQQQIGEIKVEVQEVKTKIESIERNQTHQTDILEELLRKAD